MNKNNNTNIENTENTNDSNNTENTDNTDNSDNTENTDNTDNSDNTDNTENTDNTNNSDNTDNTDNSDNNNDTDIGTISEDDICSKIGNSLTLQEQLNIANKKKKLLKIELDKTIDEYNNVIERKNRMQVEIENIHKELNLEEIKKNIEEQNKIEKLKMNIMNERKINEIKRQNELDKFYSELDFEKHKSYIEKQNEIEKMEYELNILNTKNELSKKTALSKVNETINVYPYEAYNKSCNINCCCFNSNQNLIVNFDKIYEIITNLPSLTNYEKNLILLRFSEISSYCIKKYNNVSKLYRASQIFIITCSIVNPALLSVNINQSNTNYFYIFWIVWILQLLVSLVTGFVSWFKWDKKNFLFNIYKTKINKEIWLFIGLTGKNYKSNGGEYNHSQYVNTFLNRLETIHTQLKISEFETESNSDNDNSNNTNNHNNPNNINNPRNIMVSRRRESSLNTPQSVPMPNYDNV
jgi:hypothetical protein